MSELPFVAHAWQFEASVQSNALLFSNAQQAQLNHQQLQLPAHQQPLSGIMKVPISADLA